MAGTERLPRLEGIKLLHVQGCIAGEPSSQDTWISLGTLMAFACF